MMIQVKLLGGLGNQLFQLAYAISIAEKTNDEIYLDVSVYNNYKIRSFSLQHFDAIKSCKIIDRNNLPIRFCFVLYRIYQKVMKVLKLTDFYGKWPFYILSKFGLYFNFDQKFYPITHISGTKIIYGYFQSEKYFIESKSKIYSMFRVLPELTDVERLLITKFQKSRAVAVSMRLGDDYFNCRDLNVCDDEFYHTAIQKLLKNHCEKLDFFIFSDKIEKAKEILKVYSEYNIYYVNGLTDFQSLRFMSTFDKFIIANSSFSWWGAYLSQYGDKEIICPDKWFNNISDDSDIYTSEMTKLRDYK